MPKWGTTITRQCLNDLVKCVKVKTVYQCYKNLGYKGQLPEWSTSQWPTLLGKHCQNDLVQYMKLKLWVRV